ncbi:MULTISPECIES: 2-isopropylmalate synthase [unclassified Paenibacillus]|uniref:2-isopropylmalate synthase n=1 Tax=unclassified Paenibacillus TaxID=185978 RepID=UPI0024061023|nr:MULTISPECIES: 2-isopropylmalate synthase [unclassified Paenibacillus]MDF9843551.1 2-isopropylmalate synthase [Paenibacillus sp. PastF-2]MDF9850139.1 2-isopropylmalate synthase [Paenibacillus sp. PastM-2]MDF9857119.1 2-isopropylmalate synthase [Paenibacillus sp. PastF-1]MDH6482390.1 2-isopropylmalate synthase [Paenibacillus sp. PastH-2]MDH6509272.1 2-isopropylmalate synthase [Paenibacillus sp. PastM-3]
MRKIYVFDTTLRDGEQSPGVNLNTREKVEIAYQLEKLGVDRMEAGFPAASPGDLAAVNAVAKAVKDVTVIGLSRSRETDIDAVREALKGAQDPCIHIFLATSPIHRQHKLRMEKAQVLETAQSAIRYAKKYFSKLEFSLEDAGRTERDFMAEMVAMAIREGANVVNIPDTVGYLNPSEYGAIFKFLKDTVPDIEKVQLSAHCHNDLGMATANTLAAIQNGADQIEGTINGIGERAGNTAIEEVALALETRNEFFGAKTSLVLSEISRTSRLVSRLTGMAVPGNKAIVGANAFAHESGIHQDGMLKEKTTYEIMTPETIGLKESKLVLGKHSGRHAFRDKLNDLGYDLPEEEVNTAFAKFKDLADKKKEVSDEDILALLEEKLGDTPEIFSLQTIYVTYGNESIPTAKVVIKGQEAEPIVAVAEGNGSVDAIYNAIDLATSEEVTLGDYSIKAVSRGKDAQGEVHVVLSQGEVAAQGRGLSTDILEASARAYLDALNKLLEKRKTYTRRDHAQL